jgi:hypothetical protein
MPENGFIFPSMVQYYSRNHLSENKLFLRMKNISRRDVLNSELWRISELKHQLKIILRAYEETF